MIDEQALYRRLRWRLLPYLLLLYVFVASALLLTPVPGMIALINTMGSLGGFVGPTMVGYVREATGGFTGGLLFLAALLRE